MHKDNQIAKQLSELSFWVEQYLARGNGKSRFDHAAERYMYTLGISKETFRNQIVIDIGCGPVGALKGFEAALKFGVDILARSYQPFGLAAHDIIYLAAPAEDLPFLDEFADAVVSLNALDHVDHFESVIGEIHRVLKVGGRIYLGFNLDHSPTLQEPQSLARKRVLDTLAPLFNIERAEVLESTGEFVQQAPGGQLVIHGTRLAGAVSRFQQTTFAIMDQVCASDSTTEGRDLAYALAHGAPAQIISERAAANAFVEYWRRRKGWEDRLLRSVAIAFSRQPSRMFDRGLWSISACALRSKLR